MSFDGINLISEAGIIGDKNDSASSLRLEKFDREFDLD